MKKCVTSNENIDFFYIDGDCLSIEKVQEIVSNPSIKLAITPEIEEKIKASRKTLDDFIEKGKVIYGVNTGVGGFVDWILPFEEAQSLQENLISAVATNVGPYLDADIVKASILVRLNSLARGCSAISIENFNKLMALYNAGVIPCIPSKGSLGASGDLGPLACIALVGIGKWKAYFNGELLSGEKALQMANLSPMSLSFKEGLSLVNGTSVMSAFASILVSKAEKLLKLYENISCLTFEALQAKIDPFEPLVHKQKPHIGQLEVAEKIWNTLTSSKMVSHEATTEKKIKSTDPTSAQSTNMPIEDAYSIRCTPQILGPIKDSLKWIRSVVENEINSSNDNPLVIAGENKAFHNGHFHGQYISMVMDHLSIALTTLSNLSDRRIDRLMDKNHSNGLPPFLCKESPGLRLGLMGGQFMAASITSENRSLCQPLSIQTLTSTGDFQDIVSLGLVAARRAKEIYGNLLYIISFELLCSAQGAEIRGPELLSSTTKELFLKVRKLVPYLKQDICITDYLEKIALSIQNEEL